MASSDGGGNDLPLPTADTLWRAKSQGPLTQDSPITLTYDNGKGLTFTRTIAVDDKYMFTVTDKVAEHRLGARHASSLRARLAS